MKLKVFYITVILTVLLALGGCGGDKTAALPSTPDGTVKTIVEAVANHQPQVVWRALPKSYQQDVNRIIRLYAETISEQNYNKSIGLARRVLKVLKDKKGIYLDMLGSIPGRVRISEGIASYDAVVNALEILVNSQLGSHSGLKNMDVDRFLADTGSSVMKVLSKMRLANEAMDDVTKIGIRLLSSSRGKAVVEITRNKDKSKDKLHLELVEGRWIPEKMHGRWSRETGKIISELTQRKTKAAQSNIRVAEALLKLEKFVIGLENIKNAADFMRLRANNVPDSFMEIMMMNELVRQ